MNVSPQQFPASPDELTAPWLTETLHASGVLRNGSVRSIRVADLRAQGVAGRVARLELTYNPPASDAPAIIIAKFPAPPGPTRDLALKLNLYEREAAFYRSLGPVAGVAVPRLHGAASGGSRLPALLLEDLAPAVAGDLVAGCSLERTAVVVDHVARMHARWWDSGQLASQPWLPSPVDSAEMFGEAPQGQPDAWTTFRARFGRELPASVLALGDRLRDDRSVLRRLSEPPHTLVHGDLRINNVMFSRDGSSDVGALIDWQTAVRGRGPIDIATLFVTSLKPEDRRTAEVELLPAYHAALLREGVCDYSFEQCWTDYRLALANQFSQIVFLASMIDVSSAVRDDVGAVTGARLISALTEIDLLDLVPAPSRGLGWLSRLRGRAFAAARR